MATRYKVLEELLGAVGDNPAENTLLDRLRDLGASFDYQPVTASDTVNLPGGACRSLLVGTGGAATLIAPNGSLRTAVPLQTGYNPIGALRVFSTGLTASDIWALY